MRTEAILDERDKTPSQRRPRGHVQSASTKKGNKRRGLRGRLVGLLDEDGGVDEEEEDQRTKTGRRRQTSCTECWLARCDDKMYRYNTLCGSS
jgi:hypothetical protein